MNFGNNTDETNLMDELMSYDQGGANSGKRFINRKQLIEIVTAMRRDGDEVEEILEALRDYVVDFKNTVDRPMILPIVQDVDDGRYGAARSWQRPSDVDDVRAATGGIGASRIPSPPRPVDYSGMTGGMAPMAQTMGITEQIREMYHKYIEAFQRGDLDNAMFYKNAFNELLEMRNSMFPGAAGAKRDDDDWAKQLMATMVSNMFQQQQAPPSRGGGTGDVFDDLERLGRIKEVMGWGNPQPGGLSDNAAIAALQVAAPELGKLTDTIGAIANTRQEAGKAAKNDATFQDMKNKEREIKANYTACPSCSAVIPKWAKQCHNCGAIFSDQFSNSPSSEYTQQLATRAMAGSSARGSLDPGMAGVLEPTSVPVPPTNAQQMALASRMPTQLAEPQMMEQDMIYQNDYDDWDDDMTEQEEWFETYYPRLEQWIMSNADPAQKIQAVWQLGSAYEQRQLLFIAQQLGVAGLVLGLRDYVNAHPQNASALALLEQPSSMNWLEKMFKEVRLMANEDNVMLTQNDIAEFAQVWGSAPPQMMPPQAQMMPPQPEMGIPDLNRMQQEMMGTVQMPTQAPEPQQLPNFSQAMGVVPDETLSLREKLRRRQNG